VNDLSVKEYKEIITRGLHMTKQDAIDFLSALQNMGVGVWLDGGWGVDALVGRQTRLHNDIDIFIEKKNAEAVIGLLTAKGYAETETDFTTQDHEQWRDGHGRIVDLHLFEFAEPGKAVFENTEYPSEVLGGIGQIGEITVRCLTAEAQVLFHQGYEFDDNDRSDVLLLCERFGIPVPEEFRERTEEK
jgi:lincosamide nucleotidyltransferase A/C/D/E